jgi:predicted 2-oxoglutarate/Fe(II)-dependent dioxygenase YbiX
MFNSLINNLLTKEECQTLIDMGESNSLIQMRSSKFVDGKIVNSNLEYGGNKRMGCYFVDEFLLDPTLQSLSKKIIDLSNQLKPFNSIEYLRVPKYSFNRYSEGDFLDWHEDRHEIISGATLTYIIQLNDDYVGGDIKYMIEGVEYTVPKMTGSVFIFDPNISHSVDVVKTGTRYSINVWPSSIKKINLL